jgi:hypothetical protein
MEGKFCLFMANVKNLLEYQRFFDMFDRGK